MSISLTCPCAEDAAAVKDYSFNIYSSLSQLNEAEWNKLVPEANLLMQTDYLRLLERTQPQFRFYYIIVNNGSRNVGALYFQVVKFEGAQLLNYFPEKTTGLLTVARKLSAAMLKRVNPHLLVSGNVFMTGENGFYFNSDVDKATRARILRMVVRHIRKTDSSVQAVLLSDLYEPKTAFDEGFKQRGYHEITVESDMAFVVRDEWKSFDDYLGAFSSKYRVRAKKVFTLCEANHVERKELDAAEIEKYSDRLFYLYNRVMDKAEFRLATLTPDYFRLQKEQLPDNYKLYAYFRDNNLIGFISAFHIGKRIEVHYTGMDHDLCRPIHLYQHMMYDMVEYAIEHKVEKLHFGRTAPEIKSTIGAVPAKMYGYLKHFNPLFNFFIARPYTAYLKPKEYTIRTPFKD